MRKAGSKVAPWSVKGIDDATREVAREAAREAGLTLGAWIDRAILRHAGIAPLPANDSADTESDPDTDAQGLERRVAAAEGRIEGHLRPVGLAVARVAQRMVQLERGLKSLPPDWPSTVTVAATAAASTPRVGADTETAGDAAPYGGSAGEAEEEIVFPPVAAETPTLGEADTPGEEDWEARWDRFKTELAEENPDDAASGSADAETTAAVAGENTVAPAAPDRRPVRRHFPGKLIVGGLVLIIGAGSGIALMSQSERLGIRPTLQRATDAVIGFGAEAREGLRRGTGWIEDLAWELRGGRETAGETAPAPPVVPDPVAPAPVVPAPVVPDPQPTTRPPDPPANDPPASESGANESSGSESPASEPRAAPSAPPASPPAPSPASGTPLPVAPPTAPPPAARTEGKEEARARSPAAEPKLAALPDAGNAAVKPEAAAPGFAGLVEQRARQGDPEAQHDLAVLYATGEGRPQDMREAAYWFREAAIQGVPGAQYNLGVLYEKGTGVQQDDVRALLWYHSAAERNHPRAQYNLGRFYAQGRGIPVNYTEARKWLRRAGEQNMTAALFELGQMEERGLGDAPDMSKARALYAQAAALGDQAAAERLVAMPLDNSVKPAETTGSAASAADAGAPPDPARTTPLSPDAERETLRAIQQILLRLGYAVGTVDGLLGERTREGIRDYQRRHDLPVNGTPSPLLLQHMVRIMGETPAAERTVRN